MTEIRGVAAAVVALADAIERENDALRRGDISAVAGEQEERELLLDAVESGMAARGSMRPQEMGSAARRLARLAEENRRLIAATEAGVRAAEKAAQTAAYAADGSALRTEQGQRTRHL